MRRTKTNSHKMASPKITFSCHQSRSSRSWFTIRGKTQFSSPHWNGIPAGNFVNDTLIRFDGVDGAHANFLSMKKISFFLFLALKAKRQKRNFLVTSRQSSFPLWTFWFDWRLFWLRVRFFVLIEGAWCGLYQFWKFMIKLNLLLFQLLFVGSIQSFSKILWWKNHRKQEKSWATPVWALLQ